MNNLGTEEKNNIALKIFNYIGSALIFFGVAYFIAANWNKMSDFLKVFVSLGTAILAYLVAVLFQAGHKATVSTAFYLLSGLLMPIGLFITYQVYFNHVPNQYIDIIIASICFLIFILSELRSPHILFKIFSILYGSYLYFSIIEFLIYGKPTYISNLGEYELMALGASYIFLGYYFYLSSSTALTGPLYLLGGLFVLTAAYFLGEFSDPRFIFFWKIQVLISIILAFILSLPLKSKSFLFLGTLFFIIYIIDMSSRFADVFGDNGWALILVLAGLSLMLLGYLVFILNRKISRS